MPHTESYILAKAPDECYYCTAKGEYFMRNMREVDIQKRVIAGTMYEDLSYQ